MGGGLMDFTNRGAQPQAPRATTTSNANSDGPRPLKKFADAARRTYQEPAWLRAMFMILLFSLTVLAICIVSLLYFGNPSEAKYLSRKNEQAVFLSNGQVYFGQIKEMTPKYLNMQGIYYLSSQQAQPSNQNSSSNSKNTNFSLIKLGCELHGPYDQMIISRDQVIFWENLRDDGQVVKAIKQWQQQNPNGQQCSTGSSNNDSNKQ